MAALDRSDDPFVDITSHDTYLGAVSPRRLPTAPRGAAGRLDRPTPTARGFWSVTRHAEVSEVSRTTAASPHRVGSRIESMDPEELEARRSMMELDPPDHTRLRRLVQPGFTPKVTATYEEAFRTLVDVVLDRVLPLGEFDFVTEIARELPIRMLCRLLGIPESDAGRWWPGAIR